MEWGAGTGRVTLPLARAGLEVTAVDLSPVMLAVLVERLDYETPEVRSRIHSQPGDMRSTALGRLFETVLATYNVIGHLHTPADLCAFFQNVRAHLAPGGLLLFDSLAPSSEELLADPNEEFPCDPIVHPKTGEHFEVTERFAYDFETRLLTLRSFYRSAHQTLETKLVLRQWFPQELKYLLESEGYDVSFTADYSNRPPLEAEADMLLVHATQR